MKTHFFLKALAEGDPDGCGRKVQMDFDIDFGFSTLDEEDACEDLSTCFSNFLHSLGYDGSFRYRPFSTIPPGMVPEDGTIDITCGNPSMAYNPDDNNAMRDWATQPEDLVNKLRKPNPEKEGTNGK